MLIRTGFFQPIRREGSECCLPSFLIFACALLSWGLGVDEGRLSSPCCAMYPL